jgi:hypothetical protein
VTKVVGVRTVLVVVVLWVATVGGAFWVGRESTEVPDPCDDIVVGDTILRACTGG